MVYAKRILFVLLLLVSFPNRSVDNFTHAQRYTFEQKRKKIVHSIVPFKWYENASITRHNFVDTCLAFHFIEYCLYVDFECIYISVWCTFVARSTSKSFDVSQQNRNTDKKKWFFLLLVLRLRFLKIHTPML